MPAAQFRNICFTVNNPPAPTLAESFPVPAYVKYCVAQREKGANGTVHFQGYAELNARKTLGALKLWLPTAHIETRRGTDVQARDYCMKTDSRDEGDDAGPWEHGAFNQAEPGKRNDLADARDSIMGGATKREIYMEYPSVAARHPRYVDTLLAFARSDAYKGITDFAAKFSWQQSVLDMLEHPPHPRQLLWVHDAFGNAGKTYLARYLVDSKGAFYSNGGRGTDICFTYDYEPIVIFDYVRDSKDYVNYGVIEQIKNGILSSGKYESTTKRFPTPHVIIFANFAPEANKFSDDRLVVIELDSVHEAME